MSREAKSPLVFIDHGVKINSKEYINSILKPGLLPWAKNTFGNELFTFMQDGTPSHTSKLTQGWLKNNVPGFVDKEGWPPSSPDINPLDFYLWLVLEDKVCHKYYSNTSKLRAALVKTWDQIPQDVICAAINAVPLHARCVVQTKGSHFE